MKRTLVLVAAAMFVFACGNNGSNNGGTESDSALAAIDLEQTGMNINWRKMLNDAMALDSLKLNISGSIPESQLSPISEEAGQAWLKFVGLLGLDKGKEAFEYFESHEGSFAEYLRFDTLYYLFVTKVYLPGCTVRMNQGDYQRKVVDVLEKELGKADRYINSSLYSGEIAFPDYYEDLIMQLMFAYKNAGDKDSAYKMSGMITDYVAGRYGKDNIQYANSLCSKATLAAESGSSYTAVLTARQAIKLYRQLAGQPDMSEEDAKEAAGQADYLEGMIKEWQKSE